MKTHELKKILRKHGCYFVEEGGRHERWFSPINGEKFSIGRHKKELAKYEAEDILREAGIK